jgi:hypothetical protein
MKKFLNEENQINNFKSSSGSGTVNNYGSGSDFLTSYGSGSNSQKFRFLRFRFRFHNAASLLWIREILVRIRIRRSVQLTYGSDPALFVSGLQDANKKLGSALI